MNDFEQMARTQRTGPMREMWNFLRQSKKWWLTPIIIIMIAFGLLILLSGGAAAPFIYTLF